MKKLSTKILSLAIVAVLILAFSIVPTLASAQPPSWTVTDAAATNTIDTITATNIKESGNDVEVRAYQIVKGTYKDGKLTGYVLCDSSYGAITNIEAPTSTEITAIANNIQTAIANNALTLDYIVMSKSQTLDYTYTARVEAGEYVILVSGTDDIVYNPAVVSVKVTNANLIADETDTDGGSVDMESQFVAGDTAYMKSSTTGFRKQIVVNSTTNSHVDTVAFGDTVNFVLDNMAIPSYSADYGNPDPENNVPVKYIINDDLNPDDLTDTPFLGVNSLTVKVGEDTVSPAANTFTVTYYDEAGDPTNDTTEAVAYKIEFADAFLRAHGTDSVEVTYSTTVTDDAQLALSDLSSDFVSNNTRATLQYSNDPTDATSLNDDLADETHIYTFGIDSGDDYTTYEFNKVTAAGGTYVDVEDDATPPNVITKKSPSALAGATFTLYRDADMTQVVATATSDANGHVEFVGLDANNPNTPSGTTPGTYYLKETAAPSDYSLNDNNYKVVISATYSGDVLASYTITTYLMGDTDTQIGTATYTRSQTTDNTTNPPTVTTSISLGNGFAPAEVVNTRLSVLPSTGGIGTIVISIIAGLGMAIFLTVFIISKKKSSKKN